MPSCSDNIQNQPILSILDLEKQHRALATVMRAVASSEPNQRLQNIIFMYAQKQEILEKEVIVYNVLESQCQNLLDHSRKLIISPVRVGV